MKTLREMMDLIESAQTVDEGYDWGMIEKEQLAVIEKIKKSDHSDVVKKYLIAINDPAGPVLKPEIRGHRRKAEQAKEQIMNALAQKYNVDPEEFKKAEDIEDQRADADNGTSIYDIYDSEGQLTETEVDPMRRVEELFRNK
jgi:isopenicillin N synthase-like dioxygenase